MLRNLTAVSFCSAVLFACASISTAQDAAIKPIILTVSGDTVDKEITFDRAALMAMPETMIETSTIWTDGTRTFTGVSLADLIAQMDVEGTVIVATAVNDYAVEIPIEDAIEGGPVVAYLIDGEEMSLRDKGPLWIVYPYDSDPAYRTEVVYSRSIWQLDRLQILE